MLLYFSETHKCGHTSEQHIILCYYAHANADIFNIRKKYSGKKEKRKRRPSMLLNWKHLCCFRSMSWSDSKVGFIYRFWYCLLSASSILNRVSSLIIICKWLVQKDFSIHFSIISKFVCCGCYMKKNVHYEKKITKNINFSLKNISQTVKK